MNPYDLAELWRERLMGTEVSGTVTDPMSGASAAYHLRCTAVSYSGFGEHIAIVWDDLTTGSYQRWERTAAQLAEETAETLTAELEAGVREAIAADLATRRYAALVGEEL